MRENDNDDLLRDTVQDGPLGPVRPANGFVGPRPRQWYEGPNKNGAEAEHEACPVTWHTLADIDNAALSPLLFGMLESDGANLLYAAGGTGKGTTCAWLIRECVRAGIRPLVYDAEGHPREWRRRVGGLGVALEQVVYVEPLDLPPHQLGKPLDELVPCLGDVVRAANCGILFVDSIMAGSNLAEEGLKNNAGIAYRYTAALAQLGIPSVSIGHPPKHAPEGDPYGAVTWVNAMRLTWLGTLAEGDGHRVRWTVRKKNERGHIPALLFEFEYDKLGCLCGVRCEDDETNTWNWLQAALMDGPRTVDDMADEMAEFDSERLEVAVPRAKERIRKTLGRKRRLGLVHKTGGRGAPWALGAGKRVSRKTPSFVPHPVP
jgi:hypothetical protein